MTANDLIVQGDWAWLEEAGPENQPQSFLTGSLQLYGSWFQVLAYEQDPILAFGPEDPDLADEFAQLWRFVFTGWPKPHRFPTEHFTVTEIRGRTYVLFLFPAVQS